MFEPPRARLKQIAYPRLPANADPITFYPNRQRSDSLIHLQIFASQSGFRRAQRALNGFFYPSASLLVFFIDFFTL